MSGEESTPASQQAAMLSILERSDKEQPFCLLQSFANAHKPVLKMDRWDETWESGLQMLIGDFTHNRTGQRYLVTITPIPMEAT